MKQIFDFNFATAIPGSTQTLRNLFFIDDQPGVGDTIALDTQVLNNPDNAVITLLHQTDQTVSAANHHFELYFDPDTLPDIANIEIEQSNDWAILAYQHADTGGDPKAGVSIYFLHKGASDLVLQSGTRLSLTLKKFSAASTGDVRTSTVNFNFNTASGYIRIGAQAGNQFFPSQNNPYETSGTKVIDILNKSRSIHAPLEVGFYSTNRVLNDGSTQNELQLRIVNLSATALPMVATGGTQATFQLSFDSTGAWALADSVAQQSFTVDGGNDFDVAWDHESSRWNLTPKATTWAAGSSATVTISGVVSDKATGRSLLHLGYQGIPGYGDSSFVVAVEKSALYLKGDKVGVGTTNPERALTVHASGYGIQHTDGTTKLSTFADSRGGWLGTESNHSLLFYTNGSGAQVALTTSGNVGIGKTDPSSKLEIGGSDDALRLWGTDSQYNYGAKLNFGDGDYVYLQEDQDDHLKLHARTGISLEAPEGQVNVSSNLNTDSKIQESGHDLIPRGTIVMWWGSTSDVPAGWTLCDGQNQTPDLRDRFIVGAGSSYSPGSTGGQNSVTLSEGQMPSHSHLMYSAGSHTHKLDRGWKGRNVDSGGNYEMAFDAWYNCNGENLWDGTDHHPQYHPLTTDDGSHTHTIENAGSGEAHENRPPYHALCFIMKL